MYVYNHQTYQYLTLYLVYTKTYLFYVNKGFRGVLNLPLLLILVIISPLNYSL